MKYLSIMSAAAVLACAAQTSWACTPVWVPPPEEEAKLAVRERINMTQQFEASRDIVYGVVTRGAQVGKPLQFKILHVYKGERIAGSTIPVIAAPIGPIDTCPMYNPGPLKPLVIKAGVYGILAISSDPPRLEFPDACYLDYWFRNGWIQRENPAKPLVEGGPQICLSNRYPADAKQTQPASGG